MTDFLQSAAPAGEKIDLSEVEAFAVGGLPVRPALREIGADGAQEIVEPRVLKVLVALWQEAGAVISRDRLIARAWSGRIVSDDSINNCIAKLRRIGQAREAFTIETVPRVGYRLVERRAAEAPPPRRDGPRPWRRLALIGAVLITLAAGATWGLFHILRGPEATIEVMDFSPRPATPATTAVADRLHDHLTAALASQQVNFVRSGPGTRGALRLEGTVDVADPQSELRLSLLDRKSGLILWQAAFKGSAGLDGAMPEQATARAMTAVTMASEIYSASKGRLSPTTMRTYIQLRDTNREQQNLIGQVARMRTVVAAAPDLALTHATAAQILVQAKAEQPPAVREAWTREAISEARLAIRLEPDFGGGYTALSAALGAKDYAARQAALEEGLRRAPLDGAVQSFWGLFLAETGRPLEGLPYVRRSQSLDPFAAPRRFANAPYYAAVGLVDEGRALTRANRRAWPENGRAPASESLFALLAAQPREGREMIEDLRRRYPDALPRPDLWLTVFQALECRCRMDLATSAVVAAVQDGEADPALAFVALARLGAVEPALRVAERLNAQGHLRDQRLLFAAQTSVVRDDPRFMDLAGRLGLVDYWRRSGRWPEFCAAPRRPYDCKAEAQRVARAGL